MPLQETFSKMVKEKKLSDRDVMALVNQLAAKYNQEYK